MIFLFDEYALRQRIFNVYHAMTVRARPRLWKTGKRRGKVRIEGLDSLPFTREQLWRHALAHVGTGAIRCPYCEAIGRPANLISLANCVFDHKVPRDYSGQWELDNIFAVCADCNNLKGRLSFPFFVGLMAAIERWDGSGDIMIAQRDRANVHACLRTHGVTLQGFRDKRKPQPAPEPETSGVLALQDDF